MQPESIDGSVAEYFERSVATFPDRFAVRVGSMEITYQTLNRLANQLAREILSPNLGNLPIPIYLGYDIAITTAILGIIKTGWSLILFPTRYADWRDRTAQIPFWAPAGVYDSIPPDLLEGIAP